MRLFVDSTVPVKSQVWPFYFLFLTFKNSWGTACMSCCHRAGCFARLHSVIHQRQHGEMRWLLKRYYSELNSTVKSTGSTGDTVTVTCGLKPPSIVWCLNIKLFDMLPLFQVGLTGQDCKQISHKDFNCSAERQTSLSSLIKAEPPSLPFVCVTRPQMDYVLVWRLLVEFVKNYKVSSVFLVLTVFSFFFFIHSDNGVVSDWDLYCCE